MPHVDKICLISRLLYSDFLVVAGLFLAQGLLGGLNAHYHVEPGSFYGIPVDEWIPYNISRMWHLQLALFFTSSAFLAMGIFLAPMDAGSEPCHQSALAITLFGALVVVVVGSLLGEAGGIKNFITSEGPWSFWSLNIGLLLMLFVNLVPIGTLQLYDAVANGYWHAREPEFFQSTTVHLFEWLRMIGDTLFIVGGIFPVVYLAILMFLYRNRWEKPTDGGAESFTA